MKLFQKTLFFLLASIIVVLSSPSITFAAEGEIGDAFLSSETFVTGNIEWIDITQITNNNYLVTYTDGSNNGIMKTFSISSDGNTITELDSHTFNAAATRRPDALRIPNTNYYVLVYENSLQGVMETYLIGTDGDIDDSGYTDTWTFDSGLGRDAQLVYVGNDFFALAYCQPLQSGKVGSISVTTSGDINDSGFTDTLVFSPGTSSCSSINLLETAPNYFAISYKGSVGAGMVATISVDNSGQVSDNVIDSLNYASSIYSGEDIVNIEGDYYAIAYYSGAGRMVSLEIDSTGDIINDAIIDSFVFDTPGGQTTTTLINTSGRYFVVGYNSKLRSFLFGANGDLPADENSRIDEFIYTGSNPELITRSGDIFAMAYNGSGILSTLYVEEQIAVPEYKTYIYILTIFALVGIGFRFSKKAKIVSQ